MGGREQDAPERCCLCCPLPAPPLAPPLPLPPPSPSPLPPLQPPAAWTPLKAGVTEPQSQLPLMSPHSAVRSSRKELAASLAGHGPGGLRPHPGPVPGAPPPAGPCVLSSGWPPAPVNATGSVVPVTTPRAPCWGGERYQSKDAFPCSLCLRGGHSSRAQVARSARSGGRSVGTRGPGLGGGPSH